MEVNKNSVFFLFIVAVVVKLDVLSLNNLEISGLHKYKRIGPHVLPALCTF